MKQFIKKSFILISFAMLLILFMPATAEAEEKLNRKSIILDAGKSTKLKLTDMKKKVTWSSSNKKIATVSSSGKVKAKNEGTVTIRAKNGKEKCTSEDYMLYPYTRDISCYQTINTIDEWKSYIIKMRAEGKKRSLF
ncbi:MAG: Ig-like domain-containing protein [Roseburia sp.]|nr:Ig-like domain-containing protein [Roseburia sp.]MCM1280109.1 Ig-like domain-containing protein [Robinsoniella sp.]